MTIFLETQLPPSSEGSINVDQVESDVARGDRQSILLLHLRGFEIEDPVEIDDAGAVLLHPKLGRRPGRHDAAGKVLGLLPRSQEAAERNLDFSAGRQDRVL